MKIFFILLGINDQNNHILKINVIKCLKLLNINVSVIVSVLVLKALINQKVTLFISLIKIINPFPNSIVSANHEKGSNFRGNISQL